MPATISIRPERGTALNTRQETDLLRVAVQRNPASTDLRARLAKLLNRTDAFDETIALLTSPAAGPLDYIETCRLADAYFARNGEGDIARAAAIASDRLATAENDRRRAALLLYLARAAMRGRRSTEAVVLLDRVLCLCPDHQEAYRRLAIHHLHNDEPAAVLALADRIAGQDVSHTWLFASRILAHVRLGDVDAARDQAMLERLRYTGTLPAPPGWDSIAAFNAALADEILANPALRIDRYGTASKDTVILDSLVSGGAVHARTLVDHIARTIEHHVATLAAVDHPWLSSRPASGTLNAWGAITREHGFEHWHVHPEGWMSGVYYVAVPDAVTTGSSDGGCIAFGIAEGLAGTEGAAAFGRTLVRPQPGLLALFPSYTYHRTYPHGQADHRICVAFDIWPD